MSGIERDEVSGVDTTGHEWDGVKELNNPLPQWWLTVFYATVIWGIAFTIAYPAWPMISDATKGWLGYSTRAELKQSMDALSAARAPWRDRIAAADLEAIVADSELRRFAGRAGGAAFAQHCAQCHGSGAQGAPGYPNLNDDDWLWGGALEQIHTTINHGVRNGTDDARESQMPAFGEDFEKAEVSAIAEHVLKLGGLDHDAAKAAQGAELYAENCAACHGEEGEGNQDLGAPKLADAIWLLAGDREHIANQIRSPAHGSMPAWGERLDPVTIKELTVYVYTLGGGG